MGLKKYDWSKAVPQFTPKVVRNFWRKVTQLGPDDCWPWVASQFGDGYGCFQLPFDDGCHRARKASKVAWALANGRWPTQEELVMHTCDASSSLNAKFGKHGYRRCCNPKHLKLGSNDENMRWMAETERASQGDEHWTHLRPADVNRGAAVGNSKFNSDNDVLVVRVAFLWAEMVQWPVNAKGQGLGVRLAEEFGVTRAMVSQVKLGRWWTHVKVQQPLIDAIRKAERPSSVDDLVERAKRLVREPVRHVA